MPSASRTAFPTKVFKVDLGSVKEATIGTGLIGKELGSKRRWQKGEEGVMNEDRRPRHMLCIYCKNPSVVILLHEMPKRPSGFYLGRVPSAVTYISTSLSTILNSVAPAPSEFIIHVITEPSLHRHPPWSPDSLLEFDSHSQVQ
jgi:hypothetical protein